MRLLTRCVVLAMCVLAAAAAGTSAQQAPADSTVRDSTRVTRTVPARRGPTRAQYMRRGAFAGAVLGAAAGSVKGQSDLAGCKAEDPKCRSGSLALGNTLIGGALGATVGFLVGAVWPVR